MNPNFAYTNIPNDLPAPRQQQGITAKIEEITPAIAKILMQDVQNNRSLNQRLIDRYARNMQDGNWPTNGEPIIISDRGQVMNGQHRLKAIIKSGCTITTLVVRGVKAEHMSSIDMGRKRTFADVLQMKGYPSSHLLAATLTNLWRYSLNGDFSYRDRVYQNMTIPDLEETLEAYPDVTEACSFGYKVKDLLPASLGAALFYEFEKVDSDLAREFFRQLETGDNLPLNHPILRLRNILLMNRSKSTRYHREYLAAFMIKAWNALRKGQLILRSLTWKKHGEYPEPFPRIQ